MSHMPDSVPPPPRASARPPLRRGFYLHACWKFNYPFAVRDWTQQDFAGMFVLLRELGFDLVMFWPPFESAPAPLGAAEREQLLFYRELMDAARKEGLETWVAATANCTVRPEIAAVPVAERHLYPYRVDVRLDNPPARAAYLAHRAAQQQILNNADAYVTIDGDPGSYPGATPRAFVDVLLADRANIDRYGTHPAKQKVVPWLWSGWGADWAKHGVWQDPIAPLNRPLLEELKQALPEPWELLPGRSHRDDWANGRVNVALAEEADMIPRSVLLLYELIEFEPTPPGVTIQFDVIRRVFRQEQELLRQARGVIGNAQQPIMALPNLFFFSQAARDPAQLERSDGDILRELAEFLGGDPDLLVPAWDCLRLGLADLPPDLPERLAQSTLQSEAASHIPGGPQRYLQILAAFVRARGSILRDTAGRGQRPAVEVTAACLTHAYTWWLLHRYVYDGAAGPGFRLGYVCAGLLEPLFTWLAQAPSPDGVVDEAVRLFAREIAAPELDPGLLAEDLRSGITRATAT